jgi:hypothetical protein
MSRDPFRQTFVTVHNKVHMLWKDRTREQGVPGLQTRSFEAFCDAKCLLARESNGLILERTLRFETLCPIMRVSRKGSAQFCFGRWPVLEEFPLPYEV